MCCGKENKTPVRYNAGQMNRQAFITYPVVSQPYFYATKQGGGNGIEFEAAANFDGSHLDDSLLHSMGKFSSADGLETGEYESSDDDKTDSDIDSSDYGNEDDKEIEDEDNTDSEESDEEGVDEQDLPRFRSLVKNKKLELKAQYGKTRIVMKKKCRKTKLPKAYTERECKSFCTAWYTLTRDGHHAGDCKHREEVCVNVPKVRMVEKNVCIRIPKKQWGWRKRWRDFKRAGGLAQLRMLSKGLTPPSNPLLDTPVVASQPQSVQPPKQVTNNVPVAKTPKKNAPNMIKSDKFTTATSNKTLDNLVKSQKKDSPISDSKVNDNVDKKDSNDGWSTKKKVIVGVSVIAALGTIFGILKWKKVI